MIASHAEQTGYEALGEAVRQWALELGFQNAGIADVDLGAAEEHLLAWLEAGFHGTMDYMARHGTLRTRPPELLPGTIRVISVRMDYMPEDRAAMQRQLEIPGAAYVSRYALGRDYHKLMRRRLQMLAERIREATGSTGYRVFTDSAPVMEKAIAEKAGLGWIGKHTNLIDRRAGSFFFLGEIYTDLPLPVGEAVKSHCGSCTACIEVCPTRAIVAPFRLDARRCISYLTIESRDSIPEDFRPLLGNRIYGCDDCQIVCPWNRYARLTGEADFLARHRLDRASLLELFDWDEAEFLLKTEGSAIRRIGHESWLRNIAVALGNLDEPGPAVLDALRAKMSHPSALVREHVEWAMRRHVSG